MRNFILANFMRKWKVIKISLLIYYKNFNYSLKFSAQNETFTNNKIII